MFWTRLLSGVVLVLIALVTISAGGYLLAAVCLGISLIAYGELMKACGIHGKDGTVNALEGTGYAGILCYYGIVVFTGSDTAQLFGILFVLIAFMFVYVFTFPRFRAEQVMGSFFCFAYAPAMFAFIYQTRQIGRAHV